MPQVRRRAIAAPLGVVLTLLVWAGSGRIASGRDRQFDASSNALLAVRISPLTDPNLIVSTITADIDADGDLDVVTAENDLDLQVWINDGSGHLVQQQPRRGRGWQPQDDSPTFHDRGATVLLPVRAKSPTASPSIPRHTRRLECCRPTTQPRVPVVSFVASPHSPRAPPLPLFVSPLLVEP